MYKDHVTVSPFPFQILGDARKLQTVHTHKQILLPFLDFVPCPLSFKITVVSEQTKPKRLDKEQEGRRNSKVNLHMLKNRDNWNGDRNLVKSQILFFVFWAVG